jgi:hypothetical protein
MTMFREKERSRLMTSDANNLLCREDSLIAIPCDSLSSTTGKLIRVPPFPRRAEA